MSDTSQGPDWWQASDGKWYAPQTAAAGAASTAPQSEPLDAKSAKVAAKVAQAQAKALRPWYKKKRFIGLGVIAVIVIIAIAASSGSKSNDNSSASSAGGGSTATTTAPGTPGLNQMALDGSFAFTVTSVTCNTSLSSGPLSTEAPAGSQWCLANMTVKNVKTSAQEFSSSDQKATDAKGNQLSSDTGALLYVDNSSSALSTVNPGVSIQAVVPFQLATGDTIKSLQLHDSPFSNGVTVKVS
jgi:hypothetical protein